MSIVKNHDNTLQDNEILCDDQMKSSKFGKLLQFFSVNTESPEVYRLRKKLCTMINGK